MMRIPRPAVQGIVAMIATSALVSTALAGCAGSPRVADRVDTTGNVLVGCGPLDMTAIGKTTQQQHLRQRTGQEICAWEGDDLDMTYGWLPHDTLMNEAAVATRLGYSVVHAVVKRFGGFYWRDERNESCAITTADNGTVTWWVQDGGTGGSASHVDVCSTAYRLMVATLEIDGT